MAKSKADIDLHKLEIFYWVAELRSFSQAAEHLSLRQPTVSSHVQELERTLGGKLLKRSPGEVSLTPLGRLLAEKARGLLVFKRETIAAVEQFRGELTGELSIGGSNIPGEYLLPQKLVAFVQKHPRVKPILRIGDSAATMEAVLDGKVELGFVGFKRADPRLSFQKLWQDEMVLAVAKSHPWAGRECVEISELRAERFVARERGSGTLNSLKELLAAQDRSSDDSLNIVMELGSTEAVKQALISGMGFSVLSRTSIRRELAQGILVEVAVRGLKMERDFYEVAREGRPLTPVTEAFRQFLRQPEVDE
jgi:DNA-binding transcriptional LysR family regulator